jgi:hypothetical protein
MEIATMNEKDKGHDKSFKIIVDQKRHDWPKRYITGLEIKRLAGVDPAAYDAWQDVRGPEDELIRDNEKVDLTKPEVERFFTGKKTTTEG